MKTIMILKKCAGTLAPSLSDVFNVSLASGMLPHNWKVADITPLHKKGAKNDQNNYRPVSLTSMVCKSVEILSFSIVIFVSQLGSREKQRLDDCCYLFRPFKSL